MNPLVLALLGCQQQPSPDVLQLQPVQARERSGSWQPMRVSSDRPTAKAYGTWPHFGAPLDNVAWDQLTQVALTGVELRGDGTLAHLSRWTDNAPQAVTLAAEHSVRVHLGVSTSDDQVIADLLGSSPNRDAAATALRDQVVAVGAHGVNLDVQGLDPTWKAAYVDFVGEVRAAVGEVVLTMPAVDWDGSYDFDQLALASDGLLLRGVDYRGPADDPGPVAPLRSSTTWGPYSLEWTITDYKTWGAPASSLTLGLPLHAIRWPPIDDSVPTTATGPGTLVTWAAAAELVAERRWDADSDTPYAILDPTQQLWYDDDASLWSKAALAGSEGLAGFGLFGLTYEEGDRALWRGLDALSHPDGLRLSTPVPGLTAVDNTVRITQAMAGDTVWVVVGTREGFTSIPGCANSLPMAGVRVLGSAVADGAGEATITFYVPGAAADRVAHLQAVRLADCHVTQVVTTSFADPGSSPCGPHMVLVDGSFCIDRYEGALEEWDGNSWQPADPWLTVDSRVVRAVPAAGIQPQSYLSGDEAEAACQASSKRLCTSSEWLAACRGPAQTTWPYGDSYLDGACNDDYPGTHPVVDYFGTSYGVWDPIHMNDPGIVQQDDTVSLGGELSQCVSAAGVFDMHGNVHERVADSTGTFRGGFFADAELNGPGCTYATTAHSRGYHDYSTGFRCCANPPTP